MNRKQRLLRCYSLVTCVILLNSGCAGMAGRSMLVGNEGTYSELSDSRPTIPEGKGRVFIYMVDGGPTLMNSLGIVGEPLTIDNIVHFTAGKTFFYVDLDMGKHKITASKTVKGTFKKTFRMGENAVDFVLSNQDIKYIRIDVKGSAAGVRFNKYHPILLESNESAENEISNLNLYTNHTRGMLGGTIWKIGDSFR